MDRLLERSIEISAWEDISPQVFALRAGSRVFWGLADAGWALCVELGNAKAGLARWIRTRPTALAHWQRRFPERLRDSTIGGALLVFDRRWPLATLMSLTLAAVVATQIPVARATPRIVTTSLVQPAPVLIIRQTVERPLPPAPVQLQARLDELAADYGESVGVAVSDVTTGWVASVKGDSPFPQQSVSKLWVAMTALDAVDQGKMSLDQSVMLWPDDRSVFNQPISHQITDAGYETTVANLMRRALIGSDNAANDKLMGLVGGPAAIHDMLTRKALKGIALAEDEKHLQARITGLTWSQELSPYGAFEAARAALPRETRDAAMEAYLSNPYDGASPIGIVTALAALHRGELLSDSSTQTMLATMAKATTGPRRLKGGLPAGWSIAHKTGTGQDFRGSAIGINDVGLITAPDGRTYAVAVLMRRTEQPTPQRLEFMQAVTRAVVSTWETSRPRIADLRPLDRPPQG